MEDGMAAPPTMTAESESATTDEDVHLSPSSVCSSVGGCGGGGVGRGGGRFKILCSGGGRFKILCSFGGRIMPRPSDGTLKYIGGETRVLAVPRSIPFCEMKKKVVDMFKTEVAAIKYQLLAEDLDVLVSVTCDEDLTHMLDEYDRLEAKRSPSASPRFRLYIFAPHQASSSSTAATVSRHSSYARTQPQQHYHHHHHHFQPERYVATVPATPNGSPPYPDQPNGVVSAGNSPRANLVGSEQSVFRGGMQRVRSSPNLGGLNLAPQQFNQHAGEGGGGGLGGYMGSSPVHAGAGPIFSQGSYQQYRQPVHQYSPAPLPVPAPSPYHAGVVGRYDTRGYTRGGSYSLAPVVPTVRSGRPAQEGGDDMGLIEM